LTRQKVVLFSDWFIHRSGAKVNQPINYENNLCQNWVNPEEHERRMREIFGLSPKTPETPELPEDAASDGESNPVKPLLSARLKATPANH
jgi:hypothetical protein